MGADLGATYKPAPTLILNAALWYLYSEQEFVYVGDEGIVEPSGKTVRRGIDLGARWQFAKYLFANADFTYNTARSIDAEAGQRLCAIGTYHYVYGWLELAAPIGIFG